MYIDEPEQTPRGRNKPENITVNELLSAISETEYPQYILEAIGQIQEWMKDVTEKPDEPVDEEDIFSSIFGPMFGGEDPGVSRL